MDIASTVIIMEVMNLLISIKFISPIYDERHMKDNVERAALNPGVTKILQNKQCISGIVKAT